MSTQRNMKFSFLAVAALVLLVSVTLVNCGGGGGGGGTVATPPTGVPRFAYVANLSDNTVSIFTVNVATGQLRHNGYAITGSSPRSVSVDPSGRFVYVANQNQSSLSAFTINSATGALTRIVCTGGASVCNGDTYLTGTTPYDVTVDPSGRFVYVANNGGGVSAFTINASTGALTQIDAVPGLLGIQNFPTGSNPASVTTDPSGKFVYVANDSSDNVSAYTINAATGALISAGSVTAGTSPYSVTVDPTGRFAYAANSLSNNVSAYTINATTGALTEIDQNGASAGTAVAAGTEPRTVTVDPSGRFAYVANYSSHNISAYTIHATTGVLTIIGTVAAGTNPSFVTVDPSGKFAYVENFGSNNVSTYSIHATTGALTALSTVAGRRGAMAMDMTRGTATGTFTPKFAYATNFGANTVSAYTINAVTGALTSIGSSAAAGSGAYAVTVDPGSRFVYVANSASTNVSAYTINASTGGLTAVAGSPFAAGSANYSVIVDPTGRFAYVVNNGPDTVWTYAIDAASGALIYTAPSVSTGVNPVSITIDPAGRFAYVANSDAPGTVSAYTINAGTGSLAAVAGSPFAAGSFPVSVTVDPNGKFAYVANSSSDNVSAYTINATNGALISAGTVTAGNSPSSVTVDPTGKFAYVANELSDDVSAYSIHATTGVLTRILCGGGAACSPFDGANFPAGDRPTSVVVDGSGAFAYVANRNAGTVWTYTINASTGALTTVGNVAATTVFSVTTTGSIQ